MTKFERFATYLLTVALSVEAVMFAAQHKFLLFALWLLVVLAAGWNAELPLFREVIHIRSRHDDKVYLSRYFVFGHTYSYWALMLHHMRRPDDDPCHHDHPWWFITAILKGGYEEEVSRDNALGEMVETVRNRPGMVKFREATHAHRISKLPTGSCWTLVLRGMRTRSWGFHTDIGWVWYQTFLDKTAGAVLWCGNEAVRGMKWLGFTERTGEFKQ